MCSNEPTNLRIDSTRQATWVCSAGPPFVLPYVLRANPPFVRGIVVYYGLLDLQHLRSDTPSQVLSDETLREFSPLYQLEIAAGPVPPMPIVRAGLDDPRFNGTIDRFVPAALTRNIPIQVINLPRAEHGFDVRSDTAEVRQVIRLLDFLTRVLAV